MTLKEKANLMDRILEQEQIEKYRLKMRSCKNTQLLYFYSKKIATLEGMYDDCMYTARILRLKAAKLRERGLQNLVVV